LMCLGEVNAVVTNKIYNTHLQLVEVKLSILSSCTFAIS